MIDISIGLGTGKIVAVLACDAHHHQLTPDALSLERVHCIGVSVADAWTGEIIAELLGRLIAVMGRPAAYLKDGGGDLYKAVALLAEQGLASPCIDDISHAVAGMLKRSYHAHPTFETFLSACGRASGKTQAHDLGVFGAAQSPHQSPLYECASPVHLGRPGAAALAMRRCQGLLHLRQVAVLSGSVACMQSPHQALSTRCLWPTGVPEDSQNHGALARHPRPMRTAD